MVFDPDSQEIDCPKCIQRRIFFDREIGFYCMSCGSRFSTQEIAVLIEKAELTSPSISHSGKSDKKHVPEISDMPSHKARKTEHVSQDVKGHRESNQ